MEKTPDSNLERALEAAEMGIVPVPCRPGSKIPAVPWKEWQTKMPPEELIRQWFRSACNIAIVTTGLVVFDCDDPSTKGLVIENCGETSHMLKTPRGGIHLGYRRRKGLELKNRVKIKGMDIDIRTDGGLEMIPNSVTADGRYEWLSEGLRAISDLPVANVGWTRERCRKRFYAAVPASTETPDPERLLYRARRYLEKIEPAISGQRGHDKTYATACKLARLVHYDGELLWLLLLEYNARCLPPWSEKELRHKWEDALKTRK